MKPIVLYSDIDLKTNSVFKDLAQYEKQNIIFV